MLRLICVVAPAPAQAPTGAAPPSCSSTIRRPTSSRRRRGEHDVVGIAGIARSLGPEAMRREVGAAFRLFRDAGLRFVQYKLCSTFDSSRSVGNLGVVVELARESSRTASCRSSPPCPSSGATALSASTSPALAMPSSGWTATPRCRVTRRRR